MTGGSERRKKGRGGDAGLGKIRKEKKRKMEGKERRKERKKSKGKKERRGGGGRPTVAWPVVAGGDRSWPELAGDGWPRPQKRGLLLVQV